MADIIDRARPTVTPKREAGEITTASPANTKQYVRGLSLRKNFSWTFLGNVVHAACQWGVLVVLAKLGSPAMVGQYALGLAIATPIFMLTNLQLRGVQATDARNEYSFVDYRSLRLTATMVGLIVLIGVTTFSGFERTTMLVVLIIGTTKAFEGMSDVYYGYAQQKERMDLIARSMMYKGVLSLIAMSMIMFTTGSIVLASAGIAAAWIIRFFVYDIRFTTLLSQSEGSTGFDWSRSLALAKVAFPLGIVMLLISLNTNIPRYFIQHEMGERELGFYSAIAYLMVAGTTVVNALGQSASPRLAHQYAEGNYSAFKRLMGKLVGVAVAVGVGGILISAFAGRLLLALVYTEEYAIHAGLLTLFMVTALVQYTASFFGYGMTAARYFRVQVPIFIVVVATTLIASYILIPSYGLVGAVFALIISSTVNLFGVVGINCVALCSSTKNLG